MNQNQLRDDTEPRSVDQRPIVRPVPWASVDWRLTDNAIASMHGVSKQAANKARLRHGGQPAAKVPAGRRRVLDDALDEMLGIIGHYAPRTPEELAYNDGLRDMANAVRGWTLKQRIEHALD